MLLWYNLKRNKLYNHLFQKLQLIGNKIETQYIQMIETNICCIQILQILFLEKR